MTTTNNNSTNIYLQECFTLARTMTVKLHEAAIAMEKYVSYRTRLDVPEDQADWKYYQNVCGIYHSIDAPIEIVSLDNQKKILFSKDSWLLHPYTREQYNYGTRRYKDLVLQKPTSEPFILYSLFPAEMQRSIESPNGTILAYDQSLINENEYTLMSEVQDFAYNFTRRWYNPGYAVLHDLYLGTFYVLLMNAIYMKIVTARLARAHTDQAHLFHIKSHLASYHWLDENYNSLTVMQLHWLYRNIRYITRNAGQKQTFEWLVENLFDHRELPLYEYNMKHVLDPKINDIRPVPVMKRDPLTSTVDLVAKSVDVPTTLNVTKKLAVENKEYAEINEEEIYNNLSDSAADTQKTKILECVVDNLKTANVYRLQETLITHWMAYSAMRQYNAVVEVVAPNSTVSVNINSKDAALIYMYCLFKVYYGDQYKNFNSITIHGVYVPKPDDIERLNAKIPLDTLSIAKIQKLYGVMPEYIPIGSLRDFIKYCTLATEGMYEQWKMYTSEPGDYSDSALENAALLRQRTIRIDTSSIDMDDLLVSNYIDTKEFNQSDYQQLADILQTSFIGNADGEETASRLVQKSMVQVMLKLSSYSIQIADNANDSIMLYIPTNAAKVITLQHGGQTEIITLDQSQNTELAMLDEGGFVENDLYKNVEISELETRTRLLDNQVYPDVEVELTHNNTRMHSILEDGLHTELYDMPAMVGPFYFDTHMRSYTYAGVNTTAVFNIQDRRVDIQQETKVVQIEDNSAIIDISIEGYRNNKDVFIENNYYSTAHEPMSDVINTVAVEFDCTPTTYDITKYIPTRSVSFDNTNHISAVTNYGLAFMSLSASQRASEIENLLT